MTEASFWNEQATVRRGWNCSTMCSRTPCASSSSRSGAVVASAFGDTAPELSEKELNSDASSGIPSHRFPVAVREQVLATMSAPGPTEGEAPRCRTPMGRASRRWRISGSSSSTTGRRTPGCSTACCGGGATARSRRRRARPRSRTSCAEEEFDLLLLDLHMPSPDGFAVMEQLHEQDRRDGLAARPRPDGRRGGRGQAPRAVRRGARLPHEAVRPARGAPARAQPPGDPPAAAPAARDRARARGPRRGAHRRARGGAAGGARAARDRRRVPRRRDRRARPARRRDGPAARRHRRGRARTTTQRIGIAAPLHDIGKIAIPDSLLLKPGRFTRDEHAEMQRHTSIGADMLGGTSSGLLALARDIALTHHERWDGSGYPAGLAGDEIPLAGRIVALADVFDALTHARPYKPAWPVGDAVEEIRRHAAASSTRRSSRRSPRSTIGSSSDASCRPPGMARIAPERDLPGVDARGGRRPVVGHRSLAGLRRRLLARPPARGPLAAARRAARVGRAARRRRGPCRRARRGARSRRRRRRPPGGRRVCRDFSVCASRRPASGTLVTSRPRLRLKVAAAPLVDLVVRAPPAARRPRSARSSASRARSRRTASSRGRRIASAAWSWTPHGSTSPGSCGTRGPSSRCRAPGSPCPSGIPDFRTPGTGLWSDVDPMEVAHIDAWRRDPERFWAFYDHRFQTLDGKEPNGAHLALVELERARRPRRRRHAEHRPAAPARRHPGRSSRSTGRSTTSSCLGCGSRGGARGGAPPRRRRARRRAALRRLRRSR